MTRPASVLARVAAAINGKGWDVVLRLAGLTGLVYETVVEQIDRPYLLAVFGGMIGLPSFVKKDEREKTTPPDDVKESRERDDHEA